MTFHKVKGMEASQVPQGPCSDTLVLQWNEFIIAQSLCNFDLFGASHWKLKVQPSTSALALVGPHHTIEAAILITRGQNDNSKQDELILPC